MKILLVWKDNYPWDIRVEKMGLALISFGHEVHILARNTKGQVTSEKINGMNIHRLQPFKNGYINKIASISVFFNPLWFSNIDQLCRKQKFDIIVIRDLPLVKAGIKIGRKYGIPTIFDMAEDYPAMWLDVIRDQWYKFHNYFIKNPFLGKFLEKYCVSHCDHIFVVVKESKMRLLKMGIDSKKVTIVSNTPNINKFFITTEQKICKHWKNRTVLLYQGFVNKSRGLDVVLKALPELAKKKPDILFVVIGDGKYLAKLKVLSHKLDINNHILFLGWLDFSKIPDLIQASDICVIPHYKTNHKDTTIPNKLFDYMVCGKPVIVSNAKPLKRIVEEENCGVVFQSGNLWSFVQSIKNLLENRQLRMIMGLNGQKAVKKKYNWHNDSTKLNQAIERLQR